MKKTKVLYVYKWATMGGVERVLLNRAHILKDSELEIQYDILFLHDGGGLSSFKEYLFFNGLNDFVKIREGLPLPGEYDLIFTIDTPEILAHVDASITYLECHTPYKANRKYLRNLPHNLKGIIMPSHVFKDEILNEIPEVFYDRINVLVNNVYIPSEEIESHSKIYKQTPILYVGRMDSLKNVEKVIEITAHISKDDDDFCLMLVGPIVEHEFDLKRLLKKYKMESRTLYFPPISFDRVWEMMIFVYCQKGLFISASLSESFGLSVAEAMSCGLPVMLYDNGPHMALVNSDRKYLFGGDDSNENISLKLKKIMADYDQSSEEMKNYAKKLLETFINDYKKLLQ